MPPPPPLPPPVRPPPPPAMPNFRTTGIPDRGALLTQIRSGAKLKHTVTDDRSAPLVCNKPVNEPPLGGASRPGSAQFGAGSGGASPISLGGLFAGGMSKLKPTGQRTALGISGNGPVLPSMTKESPPKEPPSFSKQIESVNQTLAQAIANRAAKLNENAAASSLSNSSMTRSSPTKSSSPERQILVQENTSAHTTNTINSSTAISAVTSTSTSTSTLTLTTTSTITTAKTSTLITNFPKDVSPTQQGRRGPPLPLKPPVAGVNRSVSQNQAKRPTHKPPPPPKNMIAKFGTIGHPKRDNVSQTQPLARRQSFGAPDSNAIALSVTKPQAAPPPPPPPRNMSVPNNMNTIHRNPPPLPPSLHSKKAPPQAPTTKPPPPPPNKTTSRSTPHLATLVGGGSAVRASSFESRFTFHNINDLSVTYEPTIDKKYPSRRKKLHQRKAPAPPLVSTEFH